MSPKHPYTSQEDKGALIHDLDNGKKLLLAAKRLQINPKTARGIKRRSDQVIAYNNENNLPPPTLHDRVALAPKAGRPYVLSEININTLDKELRVDQEHRNKLQLDVTKEVGILGSRNTIRKAALQLDIRRDRPTKKLIISDAQEDQRHTSY